MVDLFSSCVFCRIVAGTEEASIVYEDERVVAFLDVLPINPGHTLIVPRRHGAYLKEMEPEDGAAMFKAGIRIGAALRASGLKCEGVNLLLNDGAEAGQRVFHSHLHVIPRIIGDSLRRDLNGDIPLRSVLDEAAAKIRAVFV
jgi:diadenosine tetraphosphate (Ap4A) HIT family hydrolase